MYIIDIYIITHDNLHIKKKYVQCGGENNKKNSLFVNELQA